ncbi:hypothetical protein HQN89_10915 [Paenibacillus frigoriresistens]|uniref:hypothetical protein n=1 Tax=Paenibacillus alginolyticus TaxID=59839 RepID=UPI0015654820|nr:hypothetical protein [Paenibacillus frigoriresistens]NRF91530.1 hypothetical protein [Paenibacillus frigoriresistens]
MNRLHELKLKGKVGGGGTRATLTLDGFEIKGVTSVSFETSHDDVPRLKIELFIGEFDIDVQKIEITEDGK